MFLAEKKQKGEVLSKEEQKLKKVLYKWKRQQVWTNVSK